jgi:hypothetical protein
MESILTTLLSKMIKANRNGKNKVNSKKDKKFPMTKKRTSTPRNFLK